MDAAALEALLTAVNLARHECIAKVAILRVRLLAAGYPEEVVREALSYWANYEKSKS